MSQLPTIISEPESADADTQDGKDGKEGVEKEAETYENVFEYLTKGCYPLGASKAEKNILRRMSKKFTSCGRRTAEAGKMQAIKLEGSMI